MHPAIPGSPAASPSASTATPPPGWAAVASRLTFALNSRAFGTAEEGPAFRDAVAAVIDLGRVYADALAEVDRALAAREWEAEEAVAVAEARLRLARDARCDFIRAVGFAAQEGEAPANPAARFEDLADHNPAVGLLLNQSLALDLGRELMAADFSLGQTTSGCPGRRAIAHAAGALRLTRRPRPPA